MKLGQVEWVQVKLGQVKSVQDNSDQVKIFRVDHGRLSQVGSGQIKTGRVITDNL